MSDTLDIDSTTWANDQLAMIAAPFHIGGSLYLDHYAHPLPASLASVGGSLYLSGYARTRCRTGS